MFDVCLIASPGETWEQQWSYLLSNFRPRTLYTIGAVDPRVRPFVGHVEIQSAEELPGLLVLMAPRHGRYFQGELPLPDFKHPDECVYLFGADHLQVTEDYLGKRVPDLSVYIPVDTQDDMYSFMAGAVTLYDRRLKHG